MDIDFSRVNIHYLLQARELVREYPERAIALLGIPERLTTRLADIPAEVLAGLTCIKTPLLVPLQANWWWMRLLDAIANERPGQLDSVLEHGALALVR